MGDTPSSPSIIRTEKPNRKRRLPSIDCDSQAIEEDDSLTTKRSTNRAHQIVESITPYETTVGSTSTAKLPDVGDRRDRKYSDFSIENILRRPLVDFTNRPSRPVTSQLTDHLLSPSTLLSQRGVSIILFPAKTHIYNNPSV